MSFTVTGTWKGAHVHATWTDEHAWDGNAAALTVIDSRKARGDDVAQTPTGPFYPPADRPDYVAYLVAQEAFATLTLISGVVEFPSDGLPDDAVS